MGRKPRRTNPLVAIAYLRASTDEQALSPEAQRHAIEAWAAREGVTVAAWYVDQGVSGGAGIEGRPGLVEALAALGGHGAGQLVVANRTRLARSVEVAVAIERAVKSAGARVVSADGVANGEGDAEAFLRTILDGAAEYERALIRSRTKAALAAKKRRGEMTGAPPYGQQVGADGRTLEPNPAEAAILATVRGWRAEGLSLRAIITRAEAEGLRNRAGKPFAMGSVQAMVAGVKVPALPTQPAHALADRAAMQDELTEPSITLPTPLVIWQQGSRRLEVRREAGVRVAVLVDGAGGVDRVCGVYALPTRPRAS